MCVLQRRDCGCIWILKQATRKVPGGKFLRIRTEIVQNFLTFVEITGDFFAHPESAIASVESFLQGKQIDFDANRLAEEIQILLDNNSYLLIGISARDIAEVVKEAVVK